MADRGCGKQATFSLSRFRLVTLVLATIALSLPSRSAIGSIPSQFDFDYQERTGFPLSHDDRVVALGDIAAIVQNGIHSSAPDTVKDWEAVREQIMAGNHCRRQNVRVVRVYTDQPIYFHKGFALLPDPTRPDQPSDPAKDFDVESDCTNPDSLKRKRCVSLHRDHVDNRGVAALFIVARTIIVRGENRTGGLSLITMTENLWMTSADSVDLSARQDLAPTFGVGASYAVFTAQLGSPEEPYEIDMEALATQPSAPPGPGNPWWFIEDPEAGCNGGLATEAGVDLQYQFDRARSVFPDYDWSDGDPCENEADKETCWKQREPRGFAGLDGGSWFGLTYRASDLVARSFGQPGGHGGIGKAHTLDIQCGAPPVNDQLVCSIIPQGCNPAKEPCPPIGSNPPAPKDECVCTEDSCTQTACNVNYVEDLGSAGADCVVTCGLHALAKGQRGGQGGPGGRPGIIRVSAVTKVTPCSLTEADFADPNKIHALDERCVNGVADDGPGAIDCDNDNCRYDPNVTVCGLPSGHSDNQKVSYDGYASAKAVVDQIVTYANSEETAAELELFDPIVRTSQEDPLVAMLDVGQGDFLRVSLPAPDDPGSLEIEGAGTAPAWAPSFSLEMPPALYTPGAFASPASMKIPPDSGDVESQSEARANGKTPWGDFLRAVRLLLVASNPEELAGCEQQCAELSWAFVERVARFVVQPDVRMELSRLAGYPDPSDPQPQQLDLSPVRFVMVQTQFQGPPDMVLRSSTGSSSVGWPQTALGKGKPPPQVGINVIIPICFTELTSSFSTGGGQWGKGGPGGKGADNKRCAGWSPNISSHICVRPPLAQKCTREQVEKSSGGTLQCPDDRCRTLYRWPELLNTQGQVFCPDGYHAVKYKQSIFGKTVPVVCPTRIDGPGGVLCQAPDGAIGPNAFPLKGLPSKSLVRAWPRSAWAVATDRLHPLELLRRVGRANTFYKRAELLKAAARYLSTRKHTLAILNAGLFCQTPPCFVCPDDPDTLTTDTRKRLCTLDSEMASRLGRLTTGENVYGYLPNFVPPPSLATFDPLQPIDLATLVKNELAVAKNRRDFWFQFGAVLSGVYADTGTRRNELNTELATLNAALSGSLKTSFDLADLDVDAAAAEIELIRQVILQLQGLKWQLRDTDGTIFEIDAGTVAEIVVVAAATAYGGPAAGAMAAIIWETGVKQQYEAEKKEHAKGDSSEKGVSLKDFGIGGDQSPEDSRADFDESNDKFFEEFAAGLAEDIVDPAAKLISEALFAHILKLLGKSSEQQVTKATLGQVILDAVAATQMVELYRAGAKLAQALVQRRIAQQKVLEAQRRRARILASLSTLDKIDAAPGSFPSDEVQYQIADLAFATAATRVDRAGELFFLLRRAAERDGVPADPVTGESTLTSYELAEMLTEPACSGVTTASMDINFVTLDCFDRRADTLETYTGTIQRLNFTLDTQDTVVPAGDWTLDGSDFLLTLDVPLSAAHRGVRATHKKQKIEDITFFLETNDPVPAKIDILIRRPETNKDVYWIGTATDPTGLPFDVFQSFDLALAPAGQPGDLLYNILRSPASYEQNAFACNALDESSPPSLLLEDCTLSNLSPGPLKRAYLAGLSLIGQLQLRIPVASLGNRVPTKLFAHYKYTHEIVNPAQ